MTKGYPRTPEDGMAKRANGEGSIFRRKDGTWSAEATYRDDNGRTKRRTVYARTQAEVGQASRDPRTARRRSADQGHQDDAGLLAGRRDDGTTGRRDDGTTKHRGQAEGRPRPVNRANDLHRPPQRWPQGCAVARPARPSRRSGHTAAGRMTSGARPPPRGGTPRAPRSLALCHLGGPLQPCGPTQQREAADRLDQALRW